MAEGWAGVETDMPPEVVEAENNRMKREHDLQMGRAIFQKELLRWNMSTDQDGLRFSQEQTPLVMLAIEDLRARAEMADKIVDFNHDCTADQDKISKLEEQNSLLAGKVLRLTEELKEANLLMNSNKNMIEDLVTAVRNLSSRFYE